MDIRKSKLVRELAKDHPRAKHVPTMDEVKIWFRIINKEIFNGQLKDFSDIEIRRRHGCWAECTGVSYNDTRDTSLSLNHHMLSKKHFLGVLGHEMVHSYQWSNYEEMDHGETFFKWKPKFAKVGITLAECQRHSIV